MTRRAVRPALSAALLLTLGATASHAQTVIFERASGYRLTAIGERVEARASVVDARRQPIANAPIAWRIADTSVAAVSARGEVVAKRAGFTRLWAVSGRDSSSVMILVEQWAASFTFEPSPVRIDALNARAALRVDVRDAGGQPIENGESVARRPGSCRSLDERVASFTTAGEVLGRANGTTYIRCTDRGVADSVLVEVRQRAVTAAILAKAGLENKTVGDTFSIRVVARDRGNNDISGARPTWAALAPGIVSVDPSTGVARAVAAGVVRIIARVGDASDTVAVSVQGSADIAQLAGVTAAAVEAAPEAPRGPGITLQPMFPMPGDTNTVQVTVLDAGGNPVPNARVEIRTTDSSVVETLGANRIVARASGSAYLVARSGELVDSAIVTVRAREDQTLVETEFVPPTFDVEGAQRRYRARLEEAVREIEAGSLVGLPPSGRVIAVNVIGGQVAHSSRERITDRHAGPVFGATIDAAPHRLVQFNGEIRRGALASSEGGADLILTQAGGSMTFSPAAWLGFRGSYLIRTERDDLATQRWNFARGSVLLRPPFVGGAVRGLVGISVLPYATYSDRDGQRPDPLSLGGEVGLEVRTGFITAGLLYSFDRFVFDPAVASNGDPIPERVDQFSTLRLRFGLARGR